MMNPRIPLTVVANWLATIIPHCRTPSWQTLIQAPIEPLMNTITWYYDFISPYAYLQSHKLNDFSDHAAIVCKPVLFAGLLKHWGQLGPAEIVPKRQWTFEQVAYLAYRHNIPLKMPAMHPFNPLPLLRLAAALELTDQNNSANVQKIFNFVWKDGYLPTDTEPFKILMASFGIDQEHLDSEEVKSRLRLNGEQALADNIFGVPTSVIDGHKFWGFDSGEMLHSYLEKHVFWQTDEIAKANNLPQGLQRPRTNSTQ
jgi:2-hydroxychromene-2-carboxylate isomerase